jgi:hypothetical protein
MKFNINTVLILVLVGIILYMRMCESRPVEPAETRVVIDGKKYVIIKEKLDTVVKVVHSTKYVKGDTIHQYNPILVEVPQHLNLDSIAQAYYTQRIYADTLIFKDSLGYVAVTDTIFRNGILGRKWQAYPNKFYVNREIYLKEEPKVQFFAGPYAGFNRNGINYIGGMGMIKDKQDRVYTFSLGYDNINSLGVQAGFLWKIKFKKK